jgi:cell wall-associated NlpC family hydrolase
MHAGPGANLGAKDLLPLHPTSDYRSPISVLIGAPFEDLGRGPKAYDCYGIVLAGAKLLGLDLPDYGSVAAHLSQEISKMAEERKPLFERTPPTPGAIVAFTTRTPMVIDHFGLVIDDYNFLHTTRGTGGQICSLDNPMWKSFIEGFYLYAGGMR